MIDTHWFLEAIAASPFPSQRLLAQQMVNRHGREMSQSALCLTIQGRRCMQLQEAEQLAMLLEVPLAEILVHAGIDVSAGATPPAAFARRLRAALARGGRGKADDLVVDLLRSLGYAEAADLLDEERPGRTATG